MYLSPFGQRGELILEVAIGRLGKKQIMHPELISWHYYNPTGGLRGLPKETQEKYRAEDFAKWDLFVKRGTADTKEVKQ
jgi:predicted phosphoadenosine phosphosulfate sulfurtransferase